MRFSVRDAAREGAAWIARTPQVWSTALLALAIVASYLFMAGRFASIALDAQERLVDVRVGALQDAFVPLARILATSSPELSDRMRELQAQNPTILSMYVVQKHGDRWVATAATEDRLIGTDILGDDFILGLALQDRLHSLTVEESESGARVFKTVRFVGDTASGPMVAVTRQTLSEADAQVDHSIVEGIGILGVVLVLLLVLFFRHSRLIDYASLYQRLKEVDTLKDDFLSMASHELRTPLTIIRGYADELRKPLPEALRDTTIDRIDGSAKDLDALIADMLDVSRIEQGRMRFELKAVVLEDVVRPVAEGLAARAKDKGLTLTSEFAPQVSAQVDPERLRQIVLNLIGNAVKYTEKGSVAVRTYGEGGWAVFEVHDTGLGMSADEQKKLFGKFYRAESAAVRAQAGTGLGLWITKQMIEAMHGTIAVESVKDVGSRFTVSFPKAG